MGHRLGSANPQSSCRGIFRIGFARLPEMLFYCLERRSIEDIIPGLLERTTERGWRAIVRVDSDRTDERTGRPSVDLFRSKLSCPWHAGNRSSITPADLPDDRVMKTRTQHSVLFLAGGEIPVDWNSSRFADFSRVVVLFDGQDPAVLNAARTSCQKALQIAGIPRVFWRQNQSGKWEQRSPAD